MTPLPRGPIRLVIRSCGECPFVREVFGEPMCHAQARLPSDDPPAQIRTYRLWPLPPVPPDWCPLRSGPVELAVAELETP